jgi:hypothetical protein
VRWGTLKRTQNRLQHALDILENLTIPKPNDAIAFQAQFDRAQIVRRFSLAVLAAVKLDNKLLRGTGEIGDTPADWMLAAKPPLRTFLTQRSPEQPFDVCCFATEPARNECP